MFIFHMVASFFMSSLAILWTLVAIPFLFMGYTLYMITEPNTIITISKKIKYSTLRNEEDEPSGFFISKSYCGYIFEKHSKENHTNILYCLCTKNQFEELKKNNDIIIQKTDDVIDLYTRNGTFFHFNYSKREFVCTSFLARPKQSEIIKKIINYYKNNRTCVVMISGAPGTGKSFMGILLAKELKGSFCKTYRPTNPGDFLEKIYRNVKPSSDKPLIILLDEFDIIFNSFHKKKVKLHDNIPTEVYDKITWNNLLDDMNFPLFEHVILILTTNFTKHEIKKKYDPSYIRKNRINVYANLE